MEYSTGDTIVCEQLHNCGKYCVTTVHTVVENPRMMENTLFKVVKTYPCKVKDQHYFTFVPASMISDAKTRMWEIGDHDELRKEWAMQGHFSDDRMTV